MHGSIRCVRFALARDSLARVATAQLVTSIVVAEAVATTARSARDMFVTLTHAGEEDEWAMTPLAKFDTLGPEYIDVTERLSDSQCSGSLSRAQGSSRGKTDASPPRAEACDEGVPTGQLDPFATPSFSPVDLCRPRQVGRRC